MLYVRSCTAQELRIARRNIFLSELVDVPADLQTTIARIIKEATPFKRLLKIGIILTNGPGREMKSDADHGYVGAGRE